MSQLNLDINLRLNMGETKYGHGVCITGDMSDYTLNKEDSFLEMQKEEILDGIIYTAASFLRWMRYKYGAVFDDIDNNSDIINIIDNGIHMNDNISRQYSKLLENMKYIYVSTYALQKDMLFNSF